MCASFGEAFTDVLAYSDTIGTRQKCHCNQIFTASSGSLLVNSSFGTCRKCHSNQIVTLTGEIGEICSTKGPLEVLTALLKIPLNVVC